MRNNVSPEIIEHWRLLPEDEQEKFIDVCANRLKTEFIEPNINFDFMDLVWIRTVVYLEMYGTQENIDESC